jgi:hypothetical protein
LVACWLAGWLAGWLSGWLAGTLAGWLSLAGWHAKAEARHAAKQLE